MCGIVGYVGDEQCAALLVEGLRKLEYRGYDSAGVAVLGKGSKASHLTYLGDAVIGEGCNIGAGTITCNYDGQNKHVTTIEDGAFIGSDTQLVAPVTVHKGAYVGSGTTVREDVPPGALSVSAGKQRNIEGWVEKKAPRKTAKKD